MHFNCYKKTTQASYYHESEFVALYGITQDPETLEYMIIMEYASDGSLSDRLKNGYYDQCNILDILDTLGYIITGLKSIHESNLIHCDLHGGNILCHDSKYYISDLGLCKPINYYTSTDKNEIYGV